MAFMLLMLAAGACASCAIAPKLGVAFGMRAKRRAGDCESDCSRLSGAASLLLGAARLLLMESLLLISMHRGGLAGALLCFPWMLVATALLDVDVRLGYLPYELNLAFLAASIGARLSLEHGASGSLAFGLSMGLIAGALFWGAYLFGARRGKLMVGGGDVLALVAVCTSTGYGCFAGALACSAAMLVVEGVRAIKSHQGMRHAFPMAPYLMVWLVVGVCV